ncbi:hypothetical protein F5887DRAFT_1184112 [Amanita rubescens]|nr:hypothetical protein F5887DRAFT_1184112 [Amanita rubescens]
MNDIFIDDSDPNIVYSSAWLTGLGTYEFNKTAHRTVTAGSSVIYTFKGASISAYGTIGVLPTNVTNPPNGTWSIDGSSPTSFQVEVTNTNLYRQLYFQTPNIPDDGDHTLTLTFNTENNVIVWFDYFMITPSSQLSYNGDVLVKVDDTDPTVQYTGNWSEEGTSFDFNNTAHVANSPTSKVNFSFYGTAISVFGVLPNLTDSPNQPSATFTLDNGTPIVFNTVPPDQSLAIHQVPIFQSFNLTLDNHQLQIEAHDNNATLRLDFFMYEQPANTTSTTGPSHSSHSVKSGAIAGGVVGGIVVVLFGIALLIWLWRRREQANLRRLGNFSPFVAADPAFARSGSPSLSRTSGFLQSALSSAPATRPTTSHEYQPIRKEPPDVTHSQADNDVRPPPYHEGS